MLINLRYLKSFFALELLLVASCSFGVSIFGFLDYRLPRKCLFLFQAVFFYFFLFNNFLDLLWLNYNLCKKGIKFNRFKMFLYPHFLRNHYIIKEQPRYTQSILLDHFRLKICYLSYGA